MGGERGGQGDWEALGGLGGTGGGWEDTGRHWGVGVWSWRGSLGVSGWVLGALGGTGMLFMEYSVNWDGYWEALGGTGGGFWCWRGSLNGYWGGNRKGTGDTGLLSREHGMYWDG